MDPQKFLGGLTRETTIHRDAEGRWYHDGQPLEHPNLVRAFDRWVDKADDGRFCLRNDINWAYITLEGAPLFVRAAQVREGRVWLKLSDDREEPLDAASLRQDRRGALYCQARGGRLAAQFDVHAAMQLEDVLREDTQGVYLALGEQRIRPPTVDDPLVPPQG